MKTKKTWVEMAGRRNVRVHTNYQPVVRQMKVKIPERFPKIST
jgi:hypothetical protein